MQAQPHGPATLDECAAALMGVLLERVGDPQRHHELEQEGWLMGLVAHGLGVELLGERRMRRGLEPLVELARESLLRAHGRELAPPAAPLPEVGRATDAGPAACWAVVRLLWHAARESSAKKLCWSLARAPSGEHALQVDKPASPALVHLVTEAARGLPGARFEPGADAWTLFLPPGAFA